MAKQSQTSELADLIRRHRTNWAAATGAESTARRLVRAAKRFHRLCEHACNRELTKREQREAELLQKRILLLCEPLGVTPKFDGDPRGFPVKLHFGPDKKTQPGNTWGGTETGWGIG